MAQRFYGLDYADDASNGVASGTSTTGKDIEVAINLGSSDASDEYTHVKTNRAIVLSQLQRIVSELESGKLPWPPASS